MAFNKMRRRPIDHGVSPQIVDVDVGWVANGSLAIASWQQYVYGAQIPVGNGAVASIARDAAGQFSLYLDPTSCGEKMVTGDVSIICSTPGFIASYDGYIGSYTAPTSPGSGSLNYDNKNAGPGRVTIYTQPRASASLGATNDISSLALASVCVWLRFSDADY